MIINQYKLTIMFISITANCTFLSTIFMISCSTVTRQPFTPLPSRVSSSNIKEYIQQMFGLISSLVTLSIIDVEGLLAFLDKPVVVSLILAPLAVIRSSFKWSYKPEYKALLLTHCLELLTGACNHSTWAFLAFSSVFLSFSSAFFPSIFFP